LLAFYFWLWIKKRAAKKSKNNEAQKLDVKQPDEGAGKSEQAPQKQQIDQSLKDPQTELISEKTQPGQIPEADQVPKKSQPKQVTEKKQVIQIPEKHETRQANEKQQIDRSSKDPQTELIPEKNKIGPIPEKSETGQALEKTQLDPTQKEPETKQTQKKETKPEPALTLIVVPADYSGIDVDSLLPRDTEKIGNDYLPVNSKLLLRKDCFSVYINEECRAAFVVGLDYHSYSVSLSAYEISRLVSVIDPEKAISPINKSFKKHASKHAFLKIPDDPEHYYSGTSWMITCSSKNHEANFIMADYHSRPLRVPVNELAKIYEMVK